MKKLIITILMLFIMIPLALAGNIENNYIYDKVTDAPLSNSRLLVYTCADTDCNDVVGNPWYNSVSSSNVHSVEYPGTENTQYYAEYFYLDGYLSLEFVATDSGDGNVYNYDTYFEKAQDCHSPVDSLGISNTYYANEPLVINIPALVDSRVTSAFRMSTAAPFYVPAGYEDFYSALTNVTLEIFDQNNNSVHTEVQQVNLYADSQQEVVFSWTPTAPGNGYRAVVTTDVVDNQCANSILQNAQAGFNVLPSRVRDECYTILNNLEYDNQFPVAARDTVTFSYEKVSNYADDLFQKTPISTDVTYTVRAGQSTIDNPTGTIVMTQSQNIPASSSVDFETVDFTWSPADEGWYTVFIEGLGNSNLCDGKNNYPGQPQAVQVYVNPEPTVSVSFEIDDNANGQPLQGVSVTFDNITQLTDVEGKTSFDNVKATDTYSYSVTNAGYESLFGSEYIGETNTYIYLSMNEIENPNNNSAPVFTSTPVTLAELNQLYTYDADATDAENDPITYSLTQYPIGMNIDENSGIITWTPTQVGSYIVIVKATDDKDASAEQQYTLRVEDSTPNTAPVITSTEIINACSGSLYTYDVDATDAENNPITYSLTSYPNGMNIDSTTGLISWTPSATGFYAVTVRATDSRNAFSQQVYTIMVTSCNNAPEIISVPITYGCDIETYMYDVDAIDADNDPITYSLNQAPAGMSIAANGMITWSNPTAGNHVITTVASDGSLFDQQTYTLIIEAECNRAPVFVSTPTTQVLVDTQYTYDADATDADNDPLVYSIVWAPQGATINPSTGYFEWTPDTTGDFVISLRVEDPDGAYDIQSYTLTVTGIQATSVVLSANPTEGKAPLKVNFNTVASGSGTLTFEWDFDGDGKVDSTKYGSTSYTYLESGKNYAKVTVTDQLGNKASDTVLIDVDPSASEMAPRRVVHMNTVRILNDGLISPNEPVELVVGFYNDGPKDLKGVSITALFADSDGGRLRIGPMDIDKGEEISRRMIVDAPSSEGMHDLRVTVSNDEVRRVKLRSVKVN